MYLREKMVDVGLMSLDIQHQGNPKTLWFLKYKVDRGNLKWCRHEESNPGPTDYKSVALPTELCRHWLVLVFKRGCEV